jgi:hypothetical protein
MNVERPPRRAVQPKRALVGNVGGEGVPGELLQEVRRLGIDEVTEEAAPGPCRGLRVVVVGDAARGVVGLLVGPELAGGYVQGAVLANQHLWVCVPLLVRDGHDHPGEISDAREEIRGRLNLLGLGRDQDI